jgi:hypothetical protein
MRVSLYDRIRMALGLGMRCPDCKVKPMKNHKDNCPTGAWDGGVWA